MLYFSFQSYKYMKIVSICNMAGSHTEVIKYSSKLHAFVLNNPLQIIRLRNVYLELKV